MKVTVLKSHLGPTGFVHAGAEIDVDIVRHRALARTGIVPPPDGEEQPIQPAGTRPAVTGADFKPRRERVTEPKPDQTISQPKATPAATGAKAP
ncbi:hypothetical protein [Rhodopseudomonas sp. RCAM05734]|uniref:hypothetical protein n=1 Tax=Rhodopseudomonas sp. RCAM05734 TaxID=3457549 RepID=UPI004043D07D